MSEYTLTVKMVHHIGAMDDADARQTALGLIEQHGYGDLPKDAKLILRKQDRVIKLPITERK